jgi:hypothetical protein
MKLSRFTNGAAGFSLRALLPMSGTANLAKTNTVQRNISKLSKWLQKVNWGWL